MSIGQAHHEQLTEDDIRDIREVAKKDLFVFAKGICGFDWLHPRIHGPLCKLLEDRTNNRVVIVLPRGWLKTTLCSQAYPIWEGTYNPNHRCLLVQNTYVNAVAKLKTIDGIVRGNPLYRALYPEVLPDKNSVWRTDSMSLKRTRALNEGTFDAVGVGGSIVSRHYNLVIQDDTVAPDLNELGEENLLPSKESIGQAIGYHRLLPPILVNPLEDRLLVVGTRWFEKDLISWIMEHESRSYKFYTRSCRETAGVPDPVGTLTYPERFNDKVLEELERSMGPYVFSCLYYNTPVRSGDMIFDPEWFQYYESAPRDLITYTTVDLAGDPEEAKGDPDYNVVITCGKSLKTGHIYVLDYWRKKANPAEVIQAINQHVHMYSPVKVGVESIAYQRSMIYWLKDSMRRLNKYYHIEPITHGKKSKNIRIQGLQPLVKAGMLLFRRHHGELQKELVAFPMGRYDDISDALAMQIPMWAMTRTARPEATQYNASGVFDVDSALNEILSRNKKVSSLVSDLLEETYDGRTSIYTGSW